jgi:hypothetical protein
MKKGKSCVLKGYKNFKTSYGTVDSKNLKSIYINIQSWLEPKKSSDDWARQVSYFTKEVKQLLTDIIDKFIFFSKFIVDMDLRSSGICEGKRSFMNLEITLFTKEPIDFKSVKLKNSVREIISNVQKDIFESSELFDFYLTKADKISNLQLV